MELQGLPFVYGTAWKRQQTVQCVAEAIQHGFRAFDTAGQPKHYREDLVGKAIRDAFEEGIIRSRDEIYVSVEAPGANSALTETIRFKPNLPARQPRFHLMYHTLLMHL